MKHKTTLLLSTLISSQFAFAGIQTDIATSVSNHVKVIQKNHQVESNAINMLDINSRGGVKVIFTTDSNYSLYSNISEMNSNYQADSINGIVEVKSTLYDFGMNEFAYKAEQQNKMVSSLEREEVFENSLYQLLSLSSQAQHFKKKLEILKTTNAQLEEGVDVLKLRYKSGVGTITSIREVQLDQLDLENSINSLNNKKATIERMIKKEFGFEAGKVALIAKYSKNISKNTIADGTGLACLSKNGRSSLDMNRTKKMKSHTGTSVSYDIRRIKAKDNPHIFGSLKGTAHDINNGFGDYGVSAGVNVSFSLYDAGESNVAEQKARHKQNIKDSEYNTKMLEKENKFDEISFSCNDLKAKKMVLLSKKETLVKKIDDAIFRATLLETNPLERIKAQFTLNKVESEMADIDNEFTNLNLNYLNINETLIKVGLKTNQ